MPMFNKFPSKTEIALAHRYLYYCYARPVTSDYNYDQLEVLALEEEPNSDLDAPGSSRPTDYTREVKALARTLYYCATGQHLKDVINAED